MTISDGCNTIRLDPAFRVQRAQASFHNAFRVDTVAVGLESHLRVLHRNFSLESLEVVLEPDLLLYNCLFRPFRFFWEEA